MERSSVRVGIRSPENLMQRFSLFGTQGNVREERIFT
jgi:hypothetical protein